MAAWDLSAAEWRTLGGILTTSEREPAAGRPRSGEPCWIAEAILYRHYHSHGRKYRSFGWNELPSRYGISPSTANRRFREWTEDGRWYRFMTELLALRAPTRPAGRVAHPPSEILAELERAYAAFNSAFFSGILPADFPILLARTSPRCGGYFCSSGWRRGRTETGVIAIGFRCLGRGPETALGVLLHEMVHLRNWVVGMPDTNPKDQYHTRNFRDVAVVSGLLCEERHVRYGYAFTALADAGRRAVRRLRPKQDVFQWSVR